MEEEEEYKALIQNAFGSSSDSSENSSESLLVLGENPNWVNFDDEIKGLSLCTDFLTSDQQSSLLFAIQKEGWFTEATHNQAMRFGDLPPWATELSTSIREVLQFGHCDSECMDMAVFDKDKESCIFPSELLRREPLFDQLIVNSYQPGEGICAHVDLLRFEDGIALVSLESPCVMHFSAVGNGFACEGDGTEEGKEDFSSRKVPIYLNPGSLLLMWGEARYNWKHEINRKPGFQVWQGLEIDQERRISITLRKLCPTE